MCSSDKMNSKIHETLTLTLDHDTTTTRKLFGTFEENICESLKSIINYSYMFFTLLVTNNGNELLLKSNFPNFEAYGPS